MKANRRKLLVMSALYGVTATLLMPVSHASEKFPDRPIQLIVPYSPGGSADTLSRTIAQGMSEQMGQPVVVENKGGGNGMVGANVVSRAKPDGHTLYLGATGFNAIAPFIGILPEGYDPQTQLEPITKVADYRLLLVVNANSTIKTLDDLIAQAKSSKGVTYGTPGVTTTPHIAMLALEKAIGVDMVDIPYKGEAGSTIDVVGGQIDAAINSEATAISHIRAGKLRAILTMAPERYASLPDVPSIAEFYPTLGISPWFGLFTSPGTPPAVIDKLSKSLHAALAAPSIAEKLKANFYIPVTSASPAEFKQSIADETTLWKTRLEGIKFDIKN